MRTAKQTPIYVAIADDHVLIRKALINIISSDTAFQVTMEANNGSELIDQLTIAQQLPHICILDISMKKMNGFDTLEKIKKTWPSIKVLMLTMFNSEFNVYKAFKAGADGFMLKDSNPEELYEALRDIHGRRRHFSGLINEQTMLDIKTDKSYAPKITEREMEFLSLCCKELTYAEIAVMMGVGLRTIDSFRENLFAKFHVSSRTGLVAYAFQSGLIPLN